MPNVKVGRKYILWTITRNIAEHYSRDKIPEGGVDEGYRIYGDLHLDEPLGRVGALDCMLGVVKELGVSERRFIDNLAVRTEGNPPKPTETHDYSIKEIVDALELSLA